MTTERGVVDDLDTFVPRVVAQLSEGARFCGLFASAQGDAATLLRCVLAQDGHLPYEDTLVPAHSAGFPSLADHTPAAAWYEREIHDLFGLVPLGHPRLDPLVLPLLREETPPRPGSGSERAPVVIDTDPLPAHLLGEGVFTIPYGPVRSGVFESIEYLVETPGEDIPHLRTRVFHKHRGVECRFEGMGVEDGVLLAERTEGVASVAHALAFSQAIERIAQVEVSEGAAVVRVIHAELERVANHLDSTIRHTEAAGQAVAYARLSLHKERVQRLRAQLCGSRFGRGVVVPGGVGGPLRLESSQLFAAIDKIERDVRSDLRLLLATPSFVDRIRGTGLIDHELAASYALLGPVGRASGQNEDVRFTRPYAAYMRLGHQLLDVGEGGDALARQRVRNEEIAGSFHLIRQAIDRLSSTDHREWKRPLGAVSGEAMGWAEAPQGEVLYLVSIEDGALVRVKPRSASFHNLAAFHASFPKDILTDFAFIEASFGLSIAGVAG
ncbi:MAG TPA: NADH-quinone oxidoreductase subunit C [Acidimicrobiales bacterium]|nr:NADH-quinone oxidoreductase subunit C [Acidimicrobiales bacterium]